MTLSTGNRLGTYEILALLGAGGMGEVYRARDTKLAREVAIKVIPDATADDADRVARFEREAKALAALNHPRIATLYGMEQDATRHFLVMELVDGETLADRIARGPLPVGDALRLASQIAEALEAAHERGIIHRDLKPANVKVTADETVKVLDFGLAKAIDRDPAGSVNLSMSPTLSVRGTMSGVILGTAAYMSPEQAKGLPTDHRSDIFSFGCVLYELLTGKQAFPGDSVTDILASVLAREPEWQAMPPALDPRLARLLRRCLAKSIRHRWQAIGDVRAEIDHILTEPLVAPAAVAALPAVTPVKPPLWTRVVPVVAAAAIAAALAAFAVRWSTPAPAPPPVVRFSITIPPGPSEFTNFNREVIAVSADGRHVAYAGDRVYVRSIGESSAQAVPGTEGITSASHPTFSPNGQSIAYWAATDRTLKRVTFGSASVATLCPLEEGGLGLHWVGDVIYFADIGRGIRRIPANGGKVETVVPLTGREELYGPQLLPDGDTLIFTVGTRAMPAWDQARLVAQSLTTGQRTTLLEGATSGRYVSSGHLLYGRGGVLFAVRFDLKTLAVVGEPVAVIEGVRRSAPGTTGAVHFAVSPTGTLIYVAGRVAATAAVLQLSLFDRSGVAESLSAPLGAYSEPRVSPDGSSLAVVIDDSKEASIWIYGLSRSSASRRLTFGGRNTSAIWSADATRVAFQSTREGDAGIWWQRADGSDTATRLTRPDKDAAHMPRAFSPDGRHLLYDEVRGDRVKLLVLSMTDQTITPFHTQESDVPTDATFSPDGKWVTYASREPVAPSQAVVYIEPFPRTGARYQVSKSLEDGHHPVWSPDGRELFYTPGPGNRFIGVPLTTAPSLAFGEAFNLPRPFINAPPTVPRTYDITRDGKRFLGLRSDVGPDGQPIAPQIQVVLNWLNELRARVPVR